MSFRKSIQTKVIHTTYIVADVRDNWEGHGTPAHLLKKDLAHVPDAAVLIAIKLHDSLYTLEFEQQTPEETP